jgi:hypothetical protein
MTAVTAGRVAAARAWAAPLATALRMLSTAAALRLIL